MRIRYDFPTFKGNNSFQERTFEILDEKARDQIKQDLYMLRNWQILFKFEPKAKLAFPFASPPDTFVDIIHHSGKKCEYPLPLLNEIRISVVRDRISSDEPYVLKAQQELHVQKFKDINRWIRREKKKLSHEFATLSKPSSAGKFSSSQSFEKKKHAPPVTISNPESAISSSSKPG